MNVLLWPALLLACVAAQGGLSLWTGLGATPQPALAVTVVVAVLRGPAAGESFGFLSGLLLDALGTHLFGAQALAQTLVGYGVGRLRRQMDVSLPGAQMTLVALLSAVYALLLGLIALVFLGRFAAGPLKALFLAPLYNALLAPFVFQGMQRFRSREAAPTL